MAERSLRQDTDVHTVLLTGAAGQVGGSVAPALTAAGWHVRPFDLVYGDDLRDEGAVAKAVAGCAAVVHAGAIAHDSRGTPTDIVATNVLGTWHVLAAAEASQVSRVVYFSSAQVFGCAEGEGAPLYRPVDDRHPVRAARPYGMSKRLAEDMCQAWTGRTGIPTIVLRPVMILDDPGLARMSEDDAELGAFVHVDDVADGVVRALAADTQGHCRLTLCGPGDFDSSAAYRALGWRAERRWPDG
jgi:UDP-glucose 4-epimerase